MELRYKCEQLLDSLQFGKVSVYQSLIHTASSSAHFHDSYYPLALLLFLINNRPNLSQIPNIDHKEIIKFLVSPEAHGELIEQWQKRFSISSDYPYFMLVIHTLVNMIKQFMDYLTKIGCKLAPDIQILDKISSILPTGQWFEIKDMIQVFPTKLPLLTIEHLPTFFESQVIDTNNTTTKSSGKENEKKLEKRSIGKKELEINIEYEKNGLSNDSFIEDTFLLLQIIFPYTFQGR